MRSMVEGASGAELQHAPSTANAAKPAQAAQAAQACLRWAVPLPRTAGEDERAPGAARSSRDLPGGHRLAGLGVFTVFQHDAHGEQLIADAVGLLEVFGFARGCTG
jgi:hypothetical protein